MTNDSDIRATISALIARERELRARRAAGGLDAVTEHHELLEAETRLDQCWDLLRQRDAAREIGRDPSRARVRPSRIVDGYRQ